MTIKAVLFDKDVTLFDLHAMWLPAYREGAHAMAEACGRSGYVDALLLAGGYVPETNRIRAGTILASATNDEVIDLWTRELGPADQNDGPDRVRAIFHKHSIRDPIPTTDLRILFTGLRGRDLRIGVATMDTTKAVRSSLGALDVLRLIDFAVGFDAGHGAKPEPGMLNAFADAMSLETHEVAVVGDSVCDLEMGKRGGAGLLVGVLTGPAERTDLKDHADHIIESVGELDTVL